MASSEHSIAIVTQASSYCNCNSGLLPVPSSVLHLRAVSCPIHFLLLSQRIVGGLGQTSASIKWSVREAWPWLCASRKHPVVYIPFPVVAPGTPPSTHFPNCGLRSPSSLGWHQALGRMGIQSLEMLYHVSHNRTSQGPYCVDMK